MSRVNPLMVLQYQAKEIKRLQTLKWKLEVENSKLANEGRRLFAENTKLRKENRELTAKIRRYEGR